MSVVLSSTNWAYLLSKFNCLDDNVEFFYSFHYELIGKFVPHKIVRHKKIIFPLALSRLFRHLHRLRLFCKSNGSVTCFQNEYKSILKKYSKDVKNFYYRTESTMLATKDIRKFWSFLRSKFKLLVLFLLLSLMVALFLLISIRQKIFHQFIKMIMALNKS